jgi:hypothetical protein
VTDPKQRDPRGLASGAAIREVQTALTIDRGVIYLMKTRGDISPNLDEHRLAKGSLETNRRSTAFRIGGNDNHNLSRRRANNPRGMSAEINLGERTGLGDEVSAFDSDPSTLDGPERPYGIDARPGH